jgi:hypothetical protein
MNSKRILRELLSNVAYAQLLLSREKVRSGSGLRSEPESDVVETRWVGQLEIEEEIGPAISSNSAKLPFFVAGVRQRIQARL